MLHRIASISIILLIMALVSKAQEADVILSQFFAVQVDDRVFMRWTITAGYTCEDTRIERSENGSVYERIGLIGGICGSPDQPVTYEFSDTVPLPNRPVYYRLYLGQYGFSSAQYVEFVRYNDRGFLLAPNPFRDQTRITFQNKFNEDHSLEIIDLKGSVVAELFSSGDSFHVPRGNLGPGAFYFRVSRSGQVLFDGRLVVL